MSFSLCDQRLTPNRPGPATLIAINPSTLHIQIPRLQGVFFHELAAKFAFVAHEDSKEPVGVPTLIVGLPLAVLAILDRRIHRRLRPRPDPDSPPIAKP